MDVGKERKAGEQIEEQSRRLWWMEPVMEGDVLEVTAV